MSWINRAIAHTLPVVPKPVVRRVSARYIAGERIEDGVAVVRALNRQGMMATMDVLGEFVDSREEARRYGEQYRSLLQTIEREQLDSNVSLKLTMMGLKQGVDFCHEIVRKVAQEAASRGNFVRLDMEDSSCTDDTLEVYERLRQEFPGRVGCVIQAYLRRSLDDVRSLTARGANVRLCKGIYVEPEAIAYKKHGEINDNFMTLLGEMLRGGSYVGIATHDRELVERSCALIAELGLKPHQYEFQMLLGVTERLRASILERGHRLRVYVPFGVHWYAYSVRRLKENPAIAGHILRAMFNGRS